MNTEQSMKKLSTYHFESQGGPLEKCKDYQKFCVRAVYLESLLAEALPLLRLEFNANGPQRLLADRIASAVESSSEEPTRELTLIDFGYAPGNYTFKCLDCGQESVGDKRAGRCETCAAQAMRENRSGVKATAHRQECWSLEGGGRPCNCGVVNGEPERG